MNERDLKGLDKVLSDKIYFATKLLNTKPEVFINFLVEVGMKMLFESETLLKKEFKEFLKRIPGKDELL